MKTKRQSHKRDFAVLGVTGGIGSGKTSVCGFFTEIGRYVISADALGRKLTEEDSGIRKRIRSLFGDSFFSPEGQLERRKLAALVFAKRTLRKKLNRIIHPRVIAAIRDELASLPTSKRIPYVVVEAALIFEAGIEKEFDFILVVDADKKTRISRTMSRDDISKEEVLVRMKSQMTAPAKNKHGDFVLENNGTLGDLRNKVHLVDKIITGVTIGKKRAK